ncbi:MAG: hypothetical protein EA404_10895 [Spirochaetaceae bacterium]|nr:MAG: hypothetical protein EA404_10895 [Spirochaetaceae bacterium]
MAGNTYTREIVVTQDPTAPAGIFTEYDHPTNTAFQNRPLFPGRFINGEGVIRGLATGSLGIKSVELSTDNATWAPATISALAAPEWEWEFDLPNLPDGGLPEGQHILYLKVTDAVEATNTISIVVEVDNTDPEVTGPVVSLLDGSGTDYFHGTVSVTGTAGDGESEVASVVVTVDDQPLPVSGSAFYEADWDTQSLPTSGGQPVIAKDEIVVRTVVTDAAGNTAEDRLEVDVRPFITSVSRPSAYLGETGITISGNNLGRAGAPPAVTVNGGPVAAIAAASSNSVSFTLPATFPPVGGLSSGPVVVTFNGVSNAEQDPVKMDLFHLTTVADDRSPVYPDAVWHDNGSAGKLIYAYAGQQQNDRYVYFHDGMTRRQLETAGGARFAYTRVAAHDGSDLVFVTRSRDGLVIRSTTDDFAGVDPIVTETLSATATYHDIAVDSAGVAHIAYYDGGELRHRQWGGAADPPPTAGIVVDGAGSDAGMWVAITVDSSDRPHVVYHDATMNSLRYSYRTEAGTWAAPRTVDADAAGTFGNGIAIDATGGIHVSYYNGDSGNLMYAEATGPTAAFDTQIVDSQGITGWFSSIALDADNSPHITYASFSALKPKYARLSNGSFVTATIAESALYDINNNSNSTATVIDGASRVNMIYTTTDGKLRRAVYLPETLPEE